MSRIFLHLAQRCWRLTLLALAVATLALPAGLAAQTSTGAVRGYVRDQSATPVVDAQVAARSLDMGVTRTTTTNPSGFYNLGGLRPGRYELTVRRLGYSAQTRTVTVQIGQTLGVDLQMNAAAVSLQAVRVVAETEVETRTSEVGTNVSREQIRDLPTVERNILDLAKLVPGITATAPNSQDKFLAAGGQPAEAVNIFVDGATYKNDVLKGGVAGQDASKGNPFPQSAVQEFRILTQNYKAEYQKASSAIITATTRSGTNHWEGDAFLFGIARSYVARDAKAVERNEARPNYERVQGGGSIGGPIIPNKLFVFGTYELNYREQPAYVRAGADSLLAPASLNWRALQGQEISQFKQHLAFGKVSWIKTARSTIDASANVRYENDYRSFGGVNAGNDWTREAAENVKIKVYNGVGNWRYAGDRWLNEAQVNLQHFVWNPVPDNPDVIGREYIGILRTGGRDTEQRFTQNRLSLRNDVTRSDVTWLGDHVFKGGASVDFLGYEGVKYTAGNPIYKLRKDENYARPFEAFFGFGDPKINRSNQQIGLYLQDDWNPTPKLTFNLGLRWDVETNGINNDYVTPSGLADSLRTTYAPQLWVNQPVLRANGTCCDTRQVRVIDQLGGIDRYVTSGRSDRPIYWGAIQPRLGASFDFFGDGSTVAFGG
ncbi:MAG TPA: carboxypeptidase regulatory-like domain-containing protein, partial [Gemmatimonadaceae bacterium]|nr:carboxypeptidase regulatory-like domain-containing protein [Gemmatimonadaceae bacterium]